MLTKDNGLIQSLIQYSTSFRWEWIDEASRQKRWALAVTSGVASGFCLVSSLSDSPSKPYTSALGMGLSGVAIATVAAIKEDSFLYLSQKHSRRQLLAHQGTSHLNQYASTLETQNGGNGADLSGWVAEGDEESGTTLENFLKIRGIAVAEIEPVQGFSKIRYRLTHSPKIRTDDVLRNLSDLDTQLGIEAQVSRQLGFVAIDVPREDREFIPYQPQTVPDKNGFWVLIGYEQFTREPIWVNLADSTSPHILDAGVSGAGKTNKNGSILQNIFDNYSVDDCEVWIIDTKNDELLTTCQSHPMVTRYITDPDRAVEAFCQLEKIMIDRQKTRPDKHIFVLVEECADFTGKQSRFYKESYVVLDAILRKGRSAKIHMMLSTQYPKNEVLPREMTSNMPVKVCHRVVYRQNSQTVLDMDYDASKFKGKGDGVVLLPEKGLVEFQAPFLDGFRFEPCQEPLVQANPQIEPTEPQIQKAVQQSEPTEPELENWDGSGDIPPSWARFIVKCVQRKLNKKQTLEESIGLKKGGSPKYQKASDLYDLIKETIL